MLDDRYNATLLTRQEVGPGLHVLRVLPDGGVLPFQPGQHVWLGLRGDAPRIETSVPDDADEHPSRLIKRAYSLASAPREAAFELFVNAVHGGTFTPRLLAVPDGGRCWCTPSAKGTFTLDGVQSEGHLVLLATGTGLAPYVSMLRHLDREGRLEEGGRRIVLAHGVRLAADLGYRSELEALAGRSNVVYVPTVTRDSVFDGHRARISELWDRGVLAGALGRPLDPTRDHVFLCGNPEMVDEMAARARAAGFTLHSAAHPGGLHLERYW